jgi:hypothetical protein
MSDASSTALNESEFDRCIMIVLRYLETHAQVRNSDVRQITGITYDQAIYFFNRAIEVGKLKRHGRGSGTRYSVADRQ